MDDAEFKKAKMEAARRVLGSTVDTERRRLAEEAYIKHAQTPREEITDDYPMWDRPSAEQAADEGRVEWGWANGFDPRERYVPDTKMGLRAGYVVSPTDGRQAGFVEVSPGDTLYSLARRLNVDPVQFAALNLLDMAGNANELQPGRRLWFSTFGGDLREYPRVVDYTREGWDTGDPGPIGARPSYAAEGAYLGSSFAGDKDDHKALWARYHEWLQARAPGERLVSEE